MVQYDLGLVVGKGISSFTLQSTSGKSKVYRMTYTDNTYTDITITDGADASDAIVQTVTNGDTTHSPSGDAVYDYIDTIIGSIITDMES